MKILIVDDEQLARERLQRHLQELDADSHVIEAENGLIALSQIEKHTPDIVLLDIHMPEMDGIETAKEIAKLETAPAIIFTTAYDNHALDAFDSHASAYLLKPVRKEKLEKALKQANQLNQAQIQNLQLEEKEEKYLSVKIHSGIRQIDIDDIFYFFAEQKYVVVKYKDGKINNEALIEDSLKSLEERFTKQFIRIHRNALVAKQHIKAIRKDQQDHHLIELKNHDDKIEVSRRHVASIKKYLEH